MALAGVSDAPHSSQNRSPTRCSAPHVGQVTVLESGAPHPEQNLAPSRFPYPHDSQITPPVPESDSIGLIVRPRGGIGLLPQPGGFEGFSTFAKALHGPSAI